MLIYFFSISAVRFGRVPKREKAKILAAMQSSKAKVLESRVGAEMADDRKIIDTIVRAHYDTCDYTVDKIKPFVERAHASPKLTQCTGQVGFSSSVPLRYLAMKLSQIFQKIYIF